MEKRLNVRKMNELVLVFDKDLLYGFEGLLPINYPDELYIHGVSKEHADIIWLKECLSRAYFMPRGVVENDPNFKQPIPYIVLVNGGKIFAYRREGTESRLTGNISIGIGGHVNLEDRHAGAAQAVEKAAFRELKEEVEYTWFEETTKIQMHYNLCRPSAVLYAGRSNNMVNGVHFGVVYIINMNSDDVKDNLYLKDEGKQLEWMTKEELLEKSDELELWSKMVLEECL